MNHEKPHFRVETRNRYWLRISWNGQGIIRTQVFLPCHVVKEQGVLAAAKAELEHRRTNQAQTRDLQEFLGMIDRPQGLLRAI